MNADLIFTHFILFFALYLSITHNLKGSIQ